MATVWSTSSWHFLDCHLKKSRLVCLMVHKFDSSSKTNSSPVLCQPLKRMLDYHSKTSTRTFLEIHVQVITQKLFRNYWRGTKHLVPTWALNYIFCIAILPTFQKILVLLAMSKVNEFTKIWRLWKNVTRIDGMSIWWLAIVGAWNMIVLKLNTPEKVKSINFYLNLHTVIALSFVKTYINKYSIHAYLSFFIVCQYLQLFIKQAL